MKSHYQGVRRGFQGSKAGPMKELTKSGISGVRRKFNKEKTMINVSKNAALTLPKSQVILEHAKSDKRLIHAHRKAVKVAVGNLEIEQLKADLNRLVGKSRVNCQHLRNSLDFSLFAKWIGIECEIRMLLGELTGEKS